MHRPLTALIIAAMLMSIAVVGPSQGLEVDVTSKFSGGYLVRSVEGLTPEGSHPIGFGWMRVEGEPPPSDTAAFIEFRPFPDTMYETSEEPLEDAQWYLRNSGQAGGTPGADIDIGGVRALLEGTALTPSAVVVAVLDSGIDLAHPDLASVMWTNPKEVPANGIDDDANGYVDDIAGWDLIDDDNDPDDVYGHGTAVAGVLAAANNGVGIAGVAQNVALMPIRVCFSWLVPAVGDCRGDRIRPRERGTDHQPVTRNANLRPRTRRGHRRSRTSGVIVTAAAGNDGTDNDDFAYFPASLASPNVVAVTATDRFDVLGVFGSAGSNVGIESVDIAAPGVEIITTDVDGWSERTGTSFASPTRPRPPRALPHGSRPSSVSTVAGPGSMPPGSRSTTIRSTPDWNPDKVGRCSRSGRGSVNCDCCGRHHERLRRAVTDDVQQWGGEEHRADPPPPCRRVDRNDEGGRREYAAAWASRKSPKATEKGVTIARLIGGYGIRTTATRSR